MNSELDSYLSFFFLITYNQVSQ